MKKLMKMITGKKKIIIPLTALVLVGGISVGVVMALDTSSTTDDGDYIVTTTTTDTAGSNMTTSTSITTTEPITTTTTTTTAKVTTTTDKQAEQQAKVTTTTKKVTSTKKATTTKKTTTAKITTTTKKKVEEKLRLPTESELKIIESEILRLVNAERKRVGVKPLKVDPLVQKASKIRAKEQRGYEVHKRPDGSIYADVFDEVGFGVGEGYSSSENLAPRWIEKTANEKNLKAIGKSMYEGWKTSNDGHYVAMINGDYTKTGIGVYAEIENNPKVGYPRICLTGIQLFVTDFTDWDNVDFDIEM